MTAPGSREITTYTELIAGIDAERVALGVRHLDFEELAGMTPGHWGKAAGPLQVKRLGSEKIFDALRAVGLRIRLEIDPAQRAKMQSHIAQHFLPMQANQARKNNRARLWNRTIDEVLEYLSNGKGGGVSRLNAAVKAARENLSRRACEETAGAQLFRNRRVHRTTERGCPTWI